MTEMTETWREYVHEYLPQSRRTVFLGIGSILKADDAAGMILADRLTVEFADRDDVLVLGGSTAPENFTGQIKDFAPDHLVMVDAAQMGQEVGNIDIIDLDMIKRISFSTHMLPLPVMINYLLQEIGCLVSLIGIEPASTDMGDEVDERVLQAVDYLVQVFVKEIKK